MEVISVRGSPSPQFTGNLPPFVGDQFRRPRLILTRRLREIIAAVHGSPSPPFSGNLPAFAAITSTPPFAAHASLSATASPPTDAHVPLGLLVAFEGMCGSPATEPTPRQRPLVLVPCQCRLLASALQCLLLASALQCPCWFRPASTPLEPIIWSIELCQMLPAEQTFPCRLSTRLTI